jgi:hypothetical protein
MILRMARDIAIDVRMMCAFGSSASAPGSDLMTKYTMLDLITKFDDRKLISMDDSNLLQGTDAG